MYVWFWLVLAWLLSLAAVVWLLARRKHGPRLKSSEALFHFTNPQHGKSCTAFDFHEQTHFRRGLDK